VTLTVTDDFGNEGSEQATVDVNNTPPVIVSVESPAQDSLYEEGVPVALACTAVDAEDDLAGTPLEVRWNVDLVHDHHVHPGWASVTGSTGSWTPEAHGDGSHLLQLELTVTDSTGLFDSRALTLYDAGAEPLPHVVTVSDATPRLGNPLLVRAHVDFAVPPGSPLATLVFDWGDGTSDVFPDSAHQVERSTLHTYATLGSYTLRVTAFEGTRSHETTTTIEVTRPAAAAAVFLPLLAERRVSWLEQAGIADELVNALGAEREIAVFAWDQQEELAGWMQAYLDDGLLDLLVLMDLAPARVFAGEIEGSLAERWIESGNGLVWTGAAPFAESLAEDGSTVAWGDQAVDGLLDSYAGVCLGQGAEVLNPLAGRHLPSLTATTATNAVLLDRLRTKWRPWLVFARGEAKDSDAVELRHFSGGLYAQFYCVEGAGLPRAQVLAEYVRLALRGRALPR
jgi:hypothetical protein